MAKKSKTVSSDKVLMDAITQVLMQDPNKPLPEKVRVIGHDFTVKKVSDEDGMIDAGQMKISNMTILVKEGQPEIQEADTLLHEVIHCIDYLMNLDLTEHQVTALSTGLIGVFQDNHKFGKFVTRPIEG